MNDLNDDCDTLQAELDRIQNSIQTFRDLKVSFEELERHYGSGPQAEEWAQRAAGAADNIADLQQQARNVQRRLEECLEERLSRPPSIKITGIEQTQGTQFFRSVLRPCPDRPGSDSCPDNDIQLVAGKPTVLRVYVDVTIGTPAVSNLSGVLETRQAGSGTWDLPLPPYNAPITARRDADIDRGNADHTLNFRIPAGRCSDNLEIRITVFDAAHPGEADFTSGTVTRTLQFPNVLPLKIRLVRIRYQNAERGMNIPAPTVEDFWTTAEYVLKTFPIPEIELVAESEELYDGDFTSYMQAGATGETDGIFFILENLWNAEEPGSQVKYFALVPGRPANQTGFSGWAASPPPMAIGTVFAGPTMAQEIAHLCGRLHAPCGNPSGLDPAYPQYGNYPSASIGEFGVDFVDGTVLDPATTSDFMSYCGPTWVSPYTYEALMNCFPAMALAGAGLGAAEFIGEPRELLHLPVTIYRDGLVVERGPGLHLPGLLPASSGQQTPYFVELCGDQDHILEVSRLYMADVHKSLDDASLDFSVAIPWCPEANKVVFKKDETVLHTIKIGKTVPELAITSPKGGGKLTGKQTVKWTASGEDKSLTYILRYSNNSGESWRALATGLTVTEYTVDLDDLPGGEECVFQVLASEGIRTGKATSEPFSVSLKPRTASIISPHNGDIFAKAEPVHLFGIASSPGGDSADPESLNWFSSINGYLGPGLQLIVHTLSTGRHCITLTADDGCGGETSKSIYITVQIRGSR